MKFSSREVEVLQDLINLTLDDSKLDEDEWNVWNKIVDYNCANVKRFTRKEVLQALEKEQEQQGRLQGIPRVNIYKIIVELQVETGISLEEILQRRVVGPWTLVNAGRIEITP